MPAIIMWLMGVPLIVIILLYIVFLPRLSSLSLVQSGRIGHVDWNDHGTGPERWDNTDA